MSDTTTDILIIDDNLEEREMLERKVATFAAGNVLTAESANEAIAIIDRFQKSASPLLVLLDMYLVGRSVEHSLAVVKRCNQGDALSIGQLGIVVVTKGSPSEARPLLDEGAADYIPKDQGVSGHALEHRVSVTERHMTQLRQAYSAMPVNLDLPPSFVCNSPRMQEVLEELHFLAKRRKLLFLSGESGTGKGDIAKLIHRWSGHRGKFVQLYCGQNDEQPIRFRSELLGMTDNAANGLKAQAGRLEEAEGGTLFLDEVWALSPDDQRVLLEVLDSTPYSYIPLGGAEKDRRNANVRIVAATMRDPWEMVGAGKFLEALVARLTLDTGEIFEIPPLRDRLEDIEPLATQYLIREVQEEYAGIELEFTEECIEFLKSHKWGITNVRELLGIVKQCARRAVRRKEKLITRSLVESAVGVTENDNGSTTERPVSLGDVREDAEREAIKRALVKHEGKMSAAAKDLGRARGALYKTCERLKIDYKKWHEWPRIS